jgi:hypothetical protein
MANVTYEIIAYKNGYENPVININARTDFAAKRAARQYMKHYTPGECTVVKLVYRKDDGARCPLCTLHSGMQD